MKKLLILVGLLWTGAVNAQFIPGQILTAAQLNNQFALYAKLSGANFSGIVTASSISGTPISGSTGSFTNLTASGTVTFPSGSVTLPELATQSANTILANATGLAASPTAIAVPSCSTTSSALNWTTSTGFSCNTTINASTLNGATFTSPGPIGSTTPSTGSFTNLTATGTLTLPSQAANSVIANVSNSPAIPSVVGFVGCSGATSAMNYTGGTGFSCNSSINAATLNGATFASPPATGYGSTTPEPVAATTISATGAITPSQTSGIVGTTTNNNANAGSVGEYLTAQTVAQSLTSGTTANCASISLTAGDWDVWGNVYFNPAGTTTLAQWATGINTVSATLPSNSLITNFQISLAAGVGSTIPALVTRELVASTTTVYLPCLAVFNTSTLTATGVIFARRVR